MVQPDPADPSPSNTPTGTGTPATRTPGTGATGGGPDSALPPVIARVLAFGSILLGGLAGGFIGYAFGELGGFSRLATGVLLLVTAAAAAGGVAVVAVLTLRALGEWQTIRNRST